MITFEKSVGAVLFRRCGKEIEFLLLSYPAGHWDFPKGHAEKGENDEETLRREVKEETGVENLEIIPDFKARIWYFYRAKDKEKIRRKEAREKLNIFKKVVFYLVKTENPQVKISFEHTDFVWLPYDSALRKITYCDAKKVLVKAHKFLQKIK
jgi:8-oxo-dGTP pyrophosphatase MutT (NUDIX family)